MAFGKAIRNMIGAIRKMNPLSREARTIPSHYTGDWNPFRSWQGSRTRNRAANAYAHSNAARVKRREKQIRKRARRRKK